MSDENVLTKEIAEQFLADEDSVDIGEFTTIEDAAAESLGEHSGELYLGLTSLSDAAAESLSKHLGDLNLDSLTSLSDTAAESLSKHQEKLDLGGLTSISDAAAESLSKHQGELVLWGLTNISDAAAESLSKHQGKLHLDGLTSCSEKAAEYLCNHNDAKFYELESMTSTYHLLLVARMGCIGLNEITPEEIACLSEGLTASNEVDFSGIDHKILFSPDIFPSLRNLKSKIIFGEIMVDTTVAKKLSQFKAAGLDLREATIMTAEAAKALHQYRGALKIKLHNLEDATKKTILSHPSVRQWGQENSFVDVICKNCGEQERIVLSETDRSIDSLLYRDSYDSEWYGWYWGPLCPTCCKELSEDEISELD
jgi:hypothetical protein